MTFVFDGVPIDPQAALRDLDRVEYEDSLYAFFKAAWPIVDAAPWTDGWALEAIAEHLQAVCDGEIRRLIINIPPRSGKSTLTSVMFPAWLWAQPYDSTTSGPGTQILAAAYSKSLVGRDHVKCRALIESPWYQSLWGDRFSLSTDMNTKHRFSNDKRGERLITSIEAGVTGEGGNIIIVDDANSAGDVLSEATIEKTKEWWDRVMSTRLNDPKTGAFINIQQRLAEDDLTGHIQEKENDEWSQLILPMRYEGKRSYRTVGGWEDPRVKEGQLLWPERFGEKEVQKLERDLGPFACNPAEAPILMADMTMKPIGDVCAGDVIVGFDKRAVAGDASHGRYKLTPAKVLQVHTRVAKVVKITLDSGEVIRCTPDHKWYTKDRGSDREMYLPATLRSRLARVCPSKWRDRIIDGCFRSKFIQQREHVLSIEPDGEETVYALTTETGNYVVWGLASSNSAGQLQQRPEPQGGGIIKRDWWLLWDKPTPEAPKFPLFDFVLAALDTAYTIKEANDPSAMTVWGIFTDDGVAQASRILDATGRPMYAERHVDEGAPKLLLVNAWEERLELHQLVNKVHETCKQFKVDLLLIENKAAGISVAQELQRLHSRQGYGVELDDPKSQDKMARLYSVQHLFAEGMVYAPNRPWAEKVITQVGQFPKGKHDDLVDTVSASLRKLRDMGLLVRAEEHRQDIEDQLIYPNDNQMPLYPA